MYHNIFLRDASILVPQVGNKYLKRLRRTIDMCQSEQLSLEFSLIDIPGCPPQKLPHYNSLAETLSPLEQVIVHLPEGGCFKGKIPAIHKIVNAAQLLTKLSPNIKGFCIHPDVVNDFSLLEPLASSEHYISLEVLGKNSKSGNTFKEIEKLISQFDFLTLTLDTAHISEMENQGEPDLEQYIQTFYSKIRAIHLSLPGNYYDPQLMSPDFNTAHSLCHLNTKFSHKLIKPIQSLAKVNLVIEGVVPHSPYGIGLLRNEIDHLGTLFDNKTSH